MARTIRINDTLSVSGYREFMRALAVADRGTKKAVRDELRKAGEAIRADAERRFNQYSPKSAQGYRVAVRQRGLAVEQRYRKTTGTRPDWGAKQMVKALVPARNDQEAEFLDAMDKAMDQIAGIVNG